MSHLHHDGKHFCLAIVGVHELSLAVVCHVASADLFLVGFCDARDEDGRIVDALTHALYDISLQYPHRTEALVTKLILYRQVRITQGAL